MDQRQINRLDMYEAVNTYLNANTAVWSGVPILVTLKNELDTLLVSIQTQQKDQEAARIYLGNDKTTQKRFVSEKADILNDSLEAYAAINTLVELEQKAAKTFTDLYSTRNQDFITVISETITLLEQHLENLADYGVTADQITDLKNSMDQFLTLNGQPRQYRIAEKQATIQMADLFEQVTALLANRIDKVMKRFKNANTNFYNGYISARAIVGI
ncbi:hypothetical protein [Aquimarina sp. RZ0]|uniref:hypothetical protein n=1 Tax=Aquimarina sp. RZ0 TaxID=2607730 RepID=UPI0011F31BC0|nr:hypothetical protein [Aquimarina sp. RZ0]KAA1242470.1 hypothetical protein F0000_25460 [Aquimarina sp. RZ0]